MFAAPLFVVDKNWKQLRCPSVSEQINNLWYVKIPASYFVDIYKLILLQRGRRPRIADTILQEKNTQAGGLTLLNSSTSYKATVIKMAWYWQKNKQADQWNRTQNLETDPHIYSQLTFDKGVKRLQWRKDIFFSANGAETMDIHLQKKNLNIDLKPFTKITSTCIIDLKVN